MAGQVVGDMLSAFGNPMGPTMPGTSSASKPDNAKRKVAETEALQDARTTLWISATIVVLSIAVLGFGSKALNNVRIA